MFRVSSFTFVLQVFVVEMKGFERFTVSTLKLSIVFFRRMGLLCNCFSPPVMFWDVVCLSGNFQFSFMFPVLDFLYSTCDRVLIWNEGLMCHGMLYKWSAYDKNRGSWNKLLVSHKNCTREKTAKFSQFAYKVQVGRISDAYLAKA